MLLRCATSAWHAQAVRLRRGPCPGAARHRPRCCCGPRRALRSRAALLRFAAPRSRSRLRLCLRFTHTAVFASVTPRRAQRTVYRSLRQRGGAVPVYGLPPLAVVLRPARPASAPVRAKATTSRALTGKQPPPTHHRSRHTETNNSAAHAAQDVGRPKRFFPRQQPARRPRNRPSCTASPLHSSLTTIPKNQ